MPHRIYYLDKQTSGKLQKKLAQTLTSFEIKKWKSEVIEMILKSWFLRYAAFLEKYFNVTQKNTPFEKFSGTLSNSDGFCCL